MKERRDCNLKLVHKSLYQKSWPAYLRVDRVAHTRVLRSSSAIKLVIPLEKGTFQDSAAHLFNNLAANMRNNDNLKTFCKETKAFLLSVSIYYL